MTSVSMETHKAIKTLIGAGYNPKQAEAGLALLYEVQRQMHPPLWQTTMSEERWSSVSRHQG